MALPIKVEDRNSLPEGFTEYYQEQEDGSFILDVEGVDNHPDVHGLKSSLQRQKQDREKLRRERDKLKERASLLPENISAEQLQAALAMIEEKDEGGNDDDDGKNKKKPVDVAKLRQQLEMKHKEEIDSLTSKISAKERIIRALVVDTALLSALTKAKVTVPSFQKAAKKLLEGDVKIRENEDGKPIPYVDTDMGEVSVEQYVKDWTSGEEGSPFVDGNIGSGANGNKGPKGKKELSRSQFDALDQYQKTKFTKEGGRVYD